MSPARRRSALSVAVSSDTASHERRSPRLRVEPVVEPPQNDQPERDDELDALRRLLADTQRRLEAEQAARTRERQLRARLEREHAAALVAARSDLEAQRAAREASDAALHAVHASTSWRVTRPLRALSGLARR